MSQSLTIHIGSHKTGSTSIQNALMVNRSRLRENGIHFFCEDPNGKKLLHGNSSSWIKFRDDDVLRADVVPGLAQRLGKYGRHVVISTEMFSWIFAKESLKKLKINLSFFFNDIKIITYLRRQDRQIISHFQESSKSSNLPATRFFGKKTCKAMPQYQPHLALYYDYFERLSLWADVFGCDSIAIRIFEKPQLKDEDVVSDFFDLLGVPYNSKVVRLNERTGFRLTKLNHLMNQSGTRRYFRNIIASSIKDDSYLLPAKKEAFSFYSKFRESNRNLNNKFKINNREFLFDEDFSLYPKRPLDEWNETTANRAILELLEAFENVPLSKNTEIDLIRDAAIKMEILDRDMAENLMQIAARLRPEGEGIKRKLYGYEQLRNFDKRSTLARIKSRCIWTYQFLKSFINSGMG